MKGLVSVRPKYIQFENIQFRKKPILLPYS